MKYEFISKYNGVIARNGSGSSILVPVAPGSDIIKDHIWGIGPRLGFNSRWSFVKEFAVVANVAGSLLWEKFHASNQVKTHKADGSRGGGTILGPENDLRPVAELFLGIDWKKCFCNGSYLQLAAGYEMQFWWDQYTAKTSLDIEPNEDLKFPRSDCKLGFWVLT